MIRVDETDPVGEIEPSFPYRDVTIRRGIDFKDHYDIQSEIGRGKFGTVYRCKEKKTGLILAAKVVNTTRKDDRRAVEREVEIMRKLQHPRLIQLYDSIEQGKQIYVILELIEGGELFERVIDDDFVLTERSCAVFMRQICEGIEFVHSQNILHLDMKPENILCLTKEGNRIKIIDFGLAREYDPKKKLQVLFGTPEFVAPEVVNFDQIGFGTDMWSIGVICYVLLSGLSPFMGDTDIETMANVTVAKYDFDDEAFAEISEDAKDFIRSLLVKDITVRSTARQCIEHRWLSRRPKPTSVQQITNQNHPTSVIPKIQEPPASMRMTPVPTELDVTKDNLRLFVERWREHPDSPYSIEADIHQRWDNDKEAHSLRGHSPSPCGSVCSFSSESATTPNRQLCLPEFSLERRASESSGTEAHRRLDPASQIMLADEIIKLSEHLKAITGNSTIEKKAKEAPVTNGVARPKSLNITKKDSNGILKSPTKPTNSITKVSKSTTTTKTTTNVSSSSKTTNGSSAKVATSTKLNNNSSKFTSKNLSTSSKIPSSTLKLSSNNSYSKVSNNITPKVTSKVRSNTSPPKIRTSPTKTKESVSSTNDKTQAANCKNNKKKFGETCRDVPRISNLENLHKGMNLDDSTSAKNLLLKLIDEWGEMTRPQGMGRKSVSIDWCSAEESVARKSITSLAEYFQAEQLKAANAIPASIHTAE